MSHVQATTPQPPSSWLRTASGPVAAPPSWTRPWTRWSTPAVLRWSSIVLAALLIALAVVDLRTSTVRLDANRRLLATDSPLLEDIEDLYVALADADAAATTAFLRAGSEPVELRDRYDDDLAAAGAQLADIGAHIGTDAATRDRLAALTGQLATYAGLLESARANNRLTFPVGAAYLRRASGLMRDTMLPAATSLYEDAARRMESDRRAAAAPSAPLLLVTLGAVAGLALLAVQGYLAWRTRRTLNVLLLLATACLVAVVVGRAAGFEQQRARLAEAADRGSEPMLALATARILTLRALSDSHLQLVERGTDPAYAADFATVVGRLDGSDGAVGLLARAAGAGITTDRSAELVARFVDVHDQVRDLAEAGDQTTAVDLAIGDQVTIAEQIDDDLAGSLAATRDELDGLARRALDALERQRALVLLLPAAAALAVAGLWLRQREYR